MAIRESINSVHWMVVALPVALEGSGPCEGFPSRPPKEEERRSRKYHMVSPEEGFIINNLAYSVNGIT